MCEGGGGGTEGDRSRGIQVKTRTPHLGWGEKPLVFIAFPALGGPWGFLGVPGGTWEVSGESLGVPGRPWAFLGLPALP